MRALVVDDDRLARAMMADLLREASLDVAEAGNAAEALRLLPSCEVAVVDMVLPDRPGLSLLEEAARHGVATVAVTALDDPEDHLEAMRRGAYDVLRKPFAPEELRLAVARTADRVRLARENRELLERLDERARQLEEEREHLWAEVERRAGLIARGKREWERTFDAIRDPIALVEASGRVVRANRAYAGWGGLPITQIPGRACHEVLLGSPSPCEGCPRRAADAGAGEATLAMGERTVHASAFAIEGDRHVMVYRDVTETLRLARRLQESERLAAVGKLAAGVAHEINNPMASLAANLRAVRDTCAEVCGRAEETGIEGPLRERLADALAALDEAGESAGRVESIVRALGLVAGDGSSGGRPADVSECLERAVGQARQPGATAPPVAWTGRAARAALADPQRLGRALRELMKNAFQATPPGGTVQVRTFDEADRVGVEIGDDGPGIPPEVRSRVFEPFFTTRAVGQGAGLGLSVAHGIVRQMGGEIQIDSGPSAGTRVRVLLPAAGAD